MSDGGERISVSWFHVHISHVIIYTLLVVCVAFVVGNIVSPWHPICY